MAENTKKQYANELKFKDNVDSTFLLKFINAMEGRDGRSYLNIILSDSTGDIESRSWNNATQIMSQVAKGDIVLVKGKMNQFQGRRQLIIQEIQKLGSLELEGINQEDYFAKSEIDPEKMYQDLLSLVGEMDDVYLKILVENILNDADVTTRLKIWPAGKSIHHPYQSGLLEQILSCTRLALSLSSHYKVNKNFVLSGAILHDLCKIYELSSGPTVDYTDEGKLVGHLVKSLEVVDRFALKIEKFPSDTMVHLKHILLSHHGDLSFGSPKVPQTREAFLVHLIDFMDSKLGAFDLIRKTDTNPGPWSSYIKHLDRILYKADLPHYSEFMPLDLESHQ